VSRVVVTSSVAAVGPSMDWYQEVGKSGKAPEDTKALDESDWSNDEPTDSIRGYRASKVKAEQKAWELSKELGISVVCVNPSFVIGPMLGSRTDGESVGFIKGLLDGTMKEKAAQGNLKGFPKGVVDVRDVSLAHVAAMEKEEADGKRFLLTSEAAYTNVKMAQMLSETGKLKAYPLPSESQEGQVGATFNTSRAKEILGFDPRPVEVSLKDMAFAAIRLGIVEQKFVRQAASKFGKVSDLAPDSRSVYLLGKVVSLGANEQTSTEVVIGDATGLVTLVLTSDEVKAIGNVGDIVEIRNAAVKMAKGFIRVFVGKWGKIAKHEGDAEVVPNKAKDMSATEYELVKS